MTVAQPADATPRGPTVVTPDGEVIALPPNNLESDEPPLESDWHRAQIELLLACLNWLWRDRTDYYATGNLTIYYSQDRITQRDFRGPDFFVVLGTDNHPRRSWMTWAEDGKYPNVIVELLSNSTANVDRGLKKQLYQDTFRTPEYFWFHPETLEFAGFRLSQARYQPIACNDSGWLWSEQLALFLGIQDAQLRFFDADGQLVPTPNERAVQEQQQRELAHQEAEAERQAKELAQREVEVLRTRLKALGVDPDNPAALS
jgi:Uma2 family endonuclease